MTEPITVRSDLLHEEYTCFRHPSGLTVYLFPKDMLSTHAILATRFGSIDNCFAVEGEDTFTTVPDGVAHFLEHKMFENEDGEDTFAKFARTGALANAYTSFRSTAYVFTCTEKVAPSLEILVRSVFSPYFTDENVAKEQGIIAQEILMGEDDPMNALQYGMLEGLYRSLSIRTDIAGTVESIAQITPAILHRCHSAFYHPSNMILCLCGRVNLPEVRRILDALLAERPPLHVKRNYAIEAPEAYQPRVKRVMPVSRPLFCLGVKKTDIPSSAEARLRERVILSLLTGIGFGRSSDFYEELLTAGILSPTYGAWSELSPEFAFFSLYGETDDPEVVFERFAAYVSGPLIDAITEESLLRCRRALYASYLKTFDSTEEIAGLLVSDFAADGCDIFTYPEVLSSIGVDELKAAAKALFRPEAYTLSTVEPLEERSNA